MTNTIYIADNLAVLRGMETESVDLIYLDPPFNKNKTFTDKSSDASFDDTWAMSADEDEWLLDIHDLNKPLYDVIMASGGVGGESYKAYCVYMAIRLIEMHRVLKNTGGIYYHCDPTMSHSIKLVMDAVFGGKQFRNEIVWAYTGPGSPKMRQFNRKHDIIFWYSKGKSWTFNGDAVRVQHKGGQPHTGGFKGKTGNMDVMLAAEYGTKGKIPETWWSKFALAVRSSKERCGYPTQKPLALLRRIIQASSNEGDLVLDPFCGCATTCVAAQELHRKWIGIDVSSMAGKLVALRLEKELGLFMTDAAAEVTEKLPARSDAGTRSPDLAIKRKRHREQGGLCNGCDAEFPIYAFHLDHIIARAEGGQDIDANLQLLCGFCNSRKGNRTMKYLRDKNRKDGITKSA